MALLEKKLGRRDFLKSSAAATAVLAAAGLAGCAPSTKESLSETGKGAEGMNAHVVESDAAAIEGGEWITVDCWGNCGGRCVNKVLVQDGVVLRQKTDDVDADTLEHPQQRSCPRGHSMRQHVFNANRIKYPMKRKSWQPGGGENSHGELRGEEGWQRISWDEALDYVADELKRVYDNYGPRSVVCMGTDWPVLNLLGGRLQWNSTESYGNWYNAPIRMGGSISSGLPDCGNNNDRLDMLNAETIVLYGVNPAWHNAGNASYYYRLAKEAGVQFVFVGPEYNVSANMLDARWIRVRPGTDTAFLLAVAYEMIRLNNIDLDFLHKYCIGFDAESLPAGATENFQSYVLGEYDSTPKTPEWASEICGTPVEDITWFAETIGADHDVMLHHNYAPSRYRGTIDLPQLFLTVGCMGAHLGRSGNSVGATFSIEAGNGGHAEKLVRVGAVVADRAPGKTAKNELEDSQLPKSTVWRDILAGHYTCYGDYRNGEIDNGFVGRDPKEYDFDPKIIVNDFHNPLQATEDINSGIAAFKKMEMVVNIDYRFTLTAEYADIVLPCFTAWEGNLDPAQGELDVATNGIIRMSKFQCNRDYALFPRPVVQPLFESKNEQWIYTQIAERLGFTGDDIYQTSSLQAYYDKIETAEYLDPADGATYKRLVTITQEDIDAWGVAGEPQEGIISLADVLAAGKYQASRSEGDKLGHIGYKDFIDDPEANPRQSASGKIEIYCQSKADEINRMQHGPDELKPYPTFHETTWQQKDAGSYNFLMYQPHYLRRSHTTYDEGTWLREAWTNPVFVSAEDAAAKGIANGDTVRVFNDAGAFLRVATVTETLMPGCIAVPHGARTYLDKETGLDLGGNENMCVDYLTQDDYFPTCNGYNSCLVDFEKYDGEALQPDCLFEPALWTEE